PNVNKRRSVEQSDAGAFQVTVTDGAAVVLSVLTDSTALLDALNSVGAQVDTVGGVRLSGK
ncbi:hypothetical protein HW132_35275, partial [Brasilonema sp. CT11]|nr:hypothetical protein [Brasilonema sp. CT11]